MIRLAVAGVVGRMGRSVIDIAGRDAAFELVAALTSPGCRHIGEPIRCGRRKLNIRDRLDEAAAESEPAPDRRSACDVLIEFTDADASMIWLDVCRQRGIPLIIGSTGHDAHQLDRIHQAAGSIPIVKAANFSVGISALLPILDRLARTLDPDYDIEIVETHHRHKQDAPSGTALTIADTLRTALGDHAGQTVYGRHGRTGARPAGQIGIHAVRLGEIIGQHEIHFSGHGETITIRHTAHGRDTFATGAMRAARWLLGKPPALYGMNDVLAGAAASQSTGSQETP